MLNIQNYVQSLKVWMLSEKNLTLLSNLWRKMFSNLKKKVYVIGKIMYIEYIELCTFFEKLCMLKMHNCVHSLWKFLFWIYKIVNIISKKCIHWIYKIVYKKLSILNIKKMCTFNKKNNYVHFSIVWILIYKIVCIL